MNSGVVALSYVEQLSGIAALGGSAGGGFFAVKWAFEWVAGQRDKRQDRLEARADKLIESLEKRIETLTERIDTVEHLLADCQRLHSKAEADVLRLTALVEAQGEIRQRAAGVVALDRLQQAAEKKEGDNA